MSLMFMHVIIIILNYALDYFNQNNRNKYDGNVMKLNHFYYQIYFSTIVLLTRNLAVNKVEKYSDLP